MMGPYHSTRPGLWLPIVVILLSRWSLGGQAAFVEFRNCLEGNIIDSSPRLLQFVPLNVSAHFDTINPNHDLNITVYGNVTGQLTEGPYPGPSDPSWENPTETFGKIVDLEPGADLYTTLFTTFNVLSYTPYTASPGRFCNSTVNEECPLAPAFYTNSTQIDVLPGFTASHELYSSYAFTTVAATFRIQSGSTPQYYACVTAYITPDLGKSLRAILRYLPLVVLIIVGVATVGAATLSPWGSLDIFHWSSNFGRDEDILRLVTPGFGDCLQYIQFIVLAGSLSLNYPGFYQPVVSRVGWSSLLFNESLVTGGNGTESVMDGVYQYRYDSRHGMDRMVQLIGMTSPSDAWADMMVWLFTMIVSVVVLTQVGFLLRWIYRQVMNVPAEDLRSKNWYFSVGNVVRIAMGHFLLPLITLSMYQFVIAYLGPTYSIALAVVVLVIIILFTVWLVLLFVRTRPRSFLFDDLQTVLAYGPLYNTYSDDTATFALVPILVNLVRGIAIGAVQASGVAQIILLAICEVIFILTLNAFRPYPSATSMNVYHTCFSVIRLLTILLSIAFVPSLDVGSASRGWIGYAILLIHACVLVFGFFLNAIQTLIEVVARLAGAGSASGRDAPRGGLVKVFGVRQLSRRLPRADGAQRNSMASHTQMLNVQEENKDLALARARSRSISASSQLLLDATGRNVKRGSQNMDGSSAGRTTPDAASTFSKRMSKALSGSAGTGGIVGVSKPVESKDPYYRPPRRNTIDMLGDKGRPSLVADEMKEGTAAALAANEEAIDDGGESSSTPARVDREEFDETTHELTKTKTDYAVREVDFYYGVRGPALSSGTRKLKTGPADPTGPVSSARGWFQGILGGKTKEKGKGFEVVRSARAPPPGLVPPTPEVEPTPSEPYRDEPLEEGSGRAVTSPVQPRRDSVTTSVSTSEQSDHSEAGTSMMIPEVNVPAKPPLLPLIDTVGDIELPSRIGSEASKHTRPTRRAPELEIPEVPEVPMVPRKSSRRTSMPSHSREQSHDAGRVQDVRPPSAFPADRPGPHRDNTNTTTNANRLPFARNSSDKRRNRYSAANSEASSFMHHDSVDTADGGPVEERPGSVGFVNQHRTSDNIRHSPDEASFAQGSTAEYGYSGGYTAPAWNGSSAADGGNRHSRFRD